MGAGPRLAVTPGAGGEPELVTYCWVLALAAKASIAAVISLFLEPVARLLEKSLEEQSPTFARPAREVRGNQACQPSRQYVAER